MIGTMQKQVLPLQATVPIKKNSGKSSSNNTKKIRRNHKKQKKLKFQSVYRKVDPGQPSLKNSKAHFMTLVSKSLRPTNLNTRKSQIQYTAMTGALILNT